jgi:NADPH2:quinone reductase
MEAAANRGAKEFSRYGSTVHKQVYLYGSLEAGPTLLHRTYGMSWGVGGWLLTNFLRRIPPETADRLKNRVATEIKTTFASHYTKVVSLAGALEPDEIAQYSKRATGQKYLIDPTRA